MALRTDQLSYGSHVPLHQRRRFQRWLVRSAIPVFCLVAFWSGRLAGRHVAFVYWQGRCMAYAAGTDRVMYEDGLRAPLPGASTSQGIVSVNPPIAACSVPVWEKLRTYIREDWWSGIPLTPDDGVLFLHERSAPAGSPRLICAKLNVRSAHLGVCCQVIKPAGIFRAWRSSITECTVPLTHEADSRFLDPTSAQLRLFAGQPDANDPAHFTIAYELDGLPGIIDGWLEKDDTIRLAPRPPSKAASRPGHHRRTGEEWLGILSLMHGNRVENGVVATET